MSNPLNSSEIRDERRCGIVTDRAMQALTEAVAKVVEDHRQRGKPLAVWRNGQAVWMPVEPLGTLHETPPAYRTKSHGHKP